MIEVALKVILILVLALIFWQDTKDRLVIWFLYPLAGVTAFSININEVGLISALVNSALNLIIIVCILITTYLYSATVMKKKFINESLGLGDILFFICLSFTFATIAFVLLFVFSLLFSLVIHLSVANSKKSDHTVPLAGYMALFFAVIYIISFFAQAGYLFS